MAYLVEGEDDFSLCFTQGPISPCNGEGVVECSIPCLPLLLLQMLPHYDCRELRARGMSRPVRAVGFACFGMNLVGVTEDGTPCTDVYTYANTGSASSSVPGGDSERLTSSLMTCLKQDLDRLGHSSESGTGSGRGGNRVQGLEETRQRTGTPTHVSYAPIQLLRLLKECPDVARKVKTWQTLPSLIAARWCGLSSAPVSYSEASWMGLLDFKKLEVRFKIGFDGTRCAPEVSFPRDWSLTSSSR